MPAGVSYKNLTSLHEIEADPSQSIVRVPGLGTGASMTDMSAFDPSGRYIFLPHETFVGAGVTRYDIVTDRAVNLFKGDMNGGHGDWSGDFGALDPATWTPANTLLVAEEWSGEGRVFELMSPLTDVEAGEVIDLRELNSIPNVSHEGLRFNHDGTKSMGSHKINESMESMGSDSFWNQWGQTRSIFATYGSSIERCAAVGFRLSVTASRFG